ncbi:MAG: hypothetical protein EA399_07745 [Desulfovibrionales bacterium]|nr:MAG: hypothetical protein EA399_07745 [Desulfovibrionales bacterium]
MILPRPRAYIDWTVPLDEFGNEIGVCQDTATYHKYIEWLADYLYHTEIPVPENQRKDLAEFEAKEEIASAVLWLSDDLGFSLWETEMIESCCFKGLSYEEYHQIEITLWNEMPENEREVYEDPKEEFFTSEADYKRICQEAIEAKRIPSHIQHADIAYRPIFAKLLKKVASKGERIKHLNYFYHNYNECASK